MALRLRLLCVTAAVCIAADAALAQGGPPGAACHRSCLLGIADAYFAALVAHDPSKAPMAPNAKFTEQTRELKVGEGLWTTTTEGPTAFKIPVPDLEAAHIFKISGGKIHEIEAMGFTLPLYSKNGWSPFVR